MNRSMLVENQLLATKFYVPVTSGHLISRPRLMSLLNQSLEYPLILVSAPAGFGKTTLLSTWTQGLPSDKPLIAWVSLDEEDNEPRLFWTVVLTALKMQQPQCFTPLLMQLQSPQVPSLKYLLSVLINLLVEETDEFVLILDDYQVISEPQVHTSLAYLIEHLPAQLHIMVATRADPPLPLPLLRARERALEVRTDQLRCTLQETRAFLDEIMGIHLADETIQEIRSRTEGWLVGLQLLHLSLPQCVDPLALLQEVSGDQRYILDYLTEEVLRQQPQDLQWFLLCTSVLECLTASLCDAVMGQRGSQQMLERLEQANVFLVSLDSKREWYRYHALFAQALHYQLERAQADLLPQLHHRASLWYAEHGQTTEAILHAFHAKEWQWAADLIERIPLMSLISWGASEHKQAMLQDWLEQLPTDIVHSRPSLCLACTQVLWAVARPTLLDGWFDAAESVLTASLATQTHEHTSPMILDSQVQLQQENLLGGVISFRACLHSYQEDGQSVLLSCQRALALLSSDNVVSRVQVGIAQLWTFYHSSANDAVVAIHSGLQAGSLAQAAGLPVLAIGAMGSTAEHMIGTGQLHEVQRLTQQAIQLVTLPGGLVLPDGGWPSFWQAEVLREWNQLDAALSLAEEAILLCKQTSSIASLPYLFQGYTVLFHIFLSRTDYDAARHTLQQLERIGQRMNQPTALFYSSILTTVDRIRLWLACGEMNRATLWAEELDRGKRRGTPFAYEREEVACARVLLARMQPDLVLQRLEPVLQRATAGQRWGHVIEIRLLQALAYHMHRQETQALNALSEAVRLAEPEGYIRSFVDEGLAMEALLSHLHKRDRKHGPTPYLDSLLAAFQGQGMVHVQAGEHTKVQPLLDPLSQRELEVLQLLTQGVSNQEIAQELVIAIDTVKRHVSHIFSKLGVYNRIQAAIQAKKLGLLDEES